MFVEEPYLDKLFKLQDILIEHKYPITGIWAHLIEGAGDIYRGLCKGKQNGAYIGSKLERLENYILHRPLNEADFQEFNMYISGDYYRRTCDESDNPMVLKNKIQVFLRNLHFLRVATLNTIIPSIRKQPMLDALDMIYALVKYFELTPYDVPTTEFFKLSKSLDNYLIKNVGENE